MMYSRFAAVRPQFISPPHSLRRPIAAVALAAFGACLLVAGCGGGSDPVRVTVSPSTATVALSGTQTFTASVYNRGDQDVTWSVEEGSAGGTITSAGVYTAPTTVGTYHIIATSVADNSVSGTATVTVEGGSSTVTVS